MIHNSDTDTGVRAIMERIFYHKEGDQFVIPKRPSKKLVFDSLREFKNKLVLRCKDNVDTLSLQQSLAACPSHVKKLYERAYLSLLTSPLTQRDAHVKSFIKIEKTLRLDKPDPTARVVSPRGPRYNLVAGKYLRVMEKRIYKEINAIYKHCVVAKGLNPRTTAAVIQDHLQFSDDVVCVGMDASRFDQHVSKSMLEWEHSVYNAIITSEELRTILSWQVNNVCSMRLEDKIIKYTTNGTRCSGDLNTSLGNTLIMCGITYHYMTSKGLKPNVDYRVLNNGDDQLVFIPRRLLHIINDLPDKFEQLGFPMALETPVSLLEEIEFCSCKPVISSSGLSMCRIFDKAMYKDLTCNVTVNNTYMLKQWMKAVGDCGIASHGDYPIFGEIYKRYLKEAGNVDYKKLINQSSMRSSLVHMTNANMTGRPPDMRSRTSFERAFGVSIPLQYRMEQVIRDVEFNLDIEDNDFRFRDTRGLSGCTDIHHRSDLFTILLQHPRHFEPPGVAQKYIQNVRIK